VDALVRATGLARPGEATAFDLLVPLEKGGRLLQEEGTMALQLGDTAPDFVAQTTDGTIRFHEWIGDSWAVLFSHPKDFTPICTPELGSVAKLSDEFERRDVKLITMYPMQTGRNFTEMLRAVDSIQLTTKHPVATPAGWQVGEDVMPP
jgi:alkyl hydroperoxide reductase subunit AhpC